MTTNLEPYTISFPDWYDARVEFETPFKGYLSDVVVTLEDGSCYRLYFTDPIRLQQTLDDDAKTGRAYYAEPGLVILPKVTTQAIQEVVSGLWREGFFQHLKRLVEPAAKPPCLPESSAP
jgi:hypothetical protein